jgi:hypothetical protein
MQKRSSTRKRPADPNRLAAEIVAEATQRPEPEKPEKDPLAVELGRRGGLKGGKARATKLSPAKRKQIARKAAKARWSKQKSK